MNSKDFGWIGQVLEDIQIFCDMELATARRTISETNEIQPKDFHSPTVAEELILFSMCATCVHANSSGNAARVVEIHETINRMKLVSGVLPAATGYCEDRTPLVRDCPMASSRGTRTKVR